VSDVSQGEGELFNQATDTTLEKFENPPLPEIKPEAPDKPAEPTETIPPGRLREESEARRRAERELSDTRARLAAFEAVQQTRGQQPPKRLDIFDDPGGFIRQEIGPMLEQLRSEAQARAENFSADMAVRLYGAENVTGARAALEQGMGRHDPNAWATYNRAMSSHDPYGVITRWHMDREVLTQIGGDLDSYNAKILDEALKSPEFLKKAMEAARGHAAASGSQINRVTQSTVPDMPSLADIGTGGADEAMSNPSDEALFRAAVSAKRR
jgi:hypothetical protein